MQLSFKSAKLIVSICFLMLLLAVLITSNTIATSYELSIYSYTPMIFWIAVFISTIIGIALVLFSDEDHSNNWILGLLLVFFVYILCLSLFIIRGYFAWGIGGDPSSHIGFVKGILNTGFTEERLFYPITHIFSTEIIKIAGINLLDLAKLLPLIFGILFVPYMYLFSRSVFKEKREVILSTMLSCAFISGWFLNFTPNHLANLYIPLVLMMIVKSYLDKANRIKWSILLVIMVLLFPPFHPVPTIFLIIFILSLNFPLKFFKFLKIPRLSNKISEIRIRSKYTLILLISVFFTAWISSFFVWTRTVQNLNTLINEGGSTQLSGLIGTVNLASGYGYNVFEQILKVEGGIIFVLVLSVIGLYFIFKSSDEYPKRNILALYGPLTVIIIAVSVFYLINIGFGPLRLIVYLGIIGTVIAGFTLNQLLKEGEGSRWKVPCYAVIFIIISVIFVNGILTLYPSPYTYATNLQTTHSEVNAMGWLFDNKDFKTDITGISIQPGEFGDFLYGTEGRKEKLRAYKTVADLRPPYHFGYQNSTSLSNFYSKDFYMVVNQKEKLIYAEIFPDMAQYRWYPQDFDSLNSDPGINKIYSNNQIDLWFINSAK